MGKSNKVTGFRNWLQEMWMLHKDEYSDMHLPIPEADMAEYFNKYKYWLKREYRHQMKD